MVHHALRSARVRRALRAAWIFGLLLPLWLGSPCLAAAADEGLSETVARYFCAYEPTYLVLGTVEKGRTNPTTKFQFSFQTMLLDFSRPDDNVLDSCAEPSGRHLVHFGYTQKSIWDLYATSAPFEENNYNPEVVYGYHVRRFGIGWATLGIEHESNGEGGDDSRSWNRLYGRARWNFELDDRIKVLPERPNDEDHWYAAFEAKLWWPFDKDDEHVNLEKYIGYGRLRGVVRSPNYQWGSVAFDIETTKGGNPIEFDHASVQVGLSYRQPRFFGRVKFVPFFYVQYFDGYGETLIRADKHTRALRAGLRLVL
jgi:outer membrane phospholipase A